MGMKVGKYFIKLIAAKLLPTAIDYRAITQKLLMNMTNEWPGLITGRDMKQRSKIRHQERSTIERTGQWQRIMEN